MLGGVDMIVYVSWDGELRVATYRSPSDVIVTRHK